MATFAKSLPLFFFVILLLFSVQTLARESRFFSKVTRESTETAKPTTVDKVEAKEEEEPAFLPQTSENAPYGLYNRQTNLDFSPSPTTTTTTKKYNQPQYQPQKEVPAFDNNKNSKYFKNMETFETKEEATPATTEPEFYNSGQRKNYATELQGLDGYAKGDAYGGRGNGYYYNNKKGGSYYSGEKQGMSDTRFMENGKYFYDVDSEKSPATYNYGGAAAYRSRAGERAPEYYNNEGYYSGSTERFNNNYYKNTRSGFKAGEQSLQEEEEFDFDP